MEDPELVPADHEDGLPPVALVHDYFVQDGAAEAVALELARMFPTPRCTRRLRARALRGTNRPAPHPAIAARRPHPGIALVTVPPPRLHRPPQRARGPGLAPRHQRFLDVAAYPRETAGGHVATSTPRCASRRTSTPTLPTRAFRGSRSWAPPRRARPAASGSRAGPRADVLVVNSLNTSADQADLAVDSRVIYGRSTWHASRRTRSR